MTTTSVQLTYMNELKALLIEKRGVCESTARQTIEALMRLNGNAGFNSVAFLADIERIREWIEKDHSDETQKMYYGRIIATLDVMEGTRYKGTLETYRKLFHGAKDCIIKAKKERGAGLTTKEAEVWMSWPDILAHYDKVSKEVKTILSKKGDLTSVEYDRILDHMILTLYTQMTPRRNKDYAEMWVTRKEPGDDKSKNYYVIEQGKMYFNIYKTAKTHGEQIVEVPKNVQDIIYRFLTFTGCYRRSRGRAPLMPLFCSYDGAHYEQASKMTIVLNRAFGKKVSCNIIRHSYVSSLYTPAVADMEKKAAEMGHEVMTHISYFRAPVGGAGTDSSSDVGSVIDLP